MASNNNNNNTSVEQQQQDSLYTENEKGSLSLSTTTNKRVDLFAKTVRSIEEQRLRSLIEKSWEENALDTLKILFYSRDCRGGKGERDIFYQGMKWLIERDPQIFLKNLELIPTFGRWSDLLHFMDCGDQIADAVAQLIAKQLKDDVELMNQGKPISLCAKWAPTEGLHFDEKTKAVKRICQALGLGDKDKKTYRKQYLTPLRAYLKVVETYMCAKKWDEIDYSKVPGVAMNKLKKAFAKNDKERFEEFQAKLKRGDKDVKVNAGTVEPHDLCRQYMRYGQTEEDTITEEQWKKVVERVSQLGTMTHSIVVSDVSGSMSGTPMEVSIALGLIISELTLPPFKNQIITFHEHPTFFEVTGTTLKDRVQQLMGAPWGGSTNLQLVFDIILQRAKSNNVRPEDMPSRVYIISDMQFDQADHGGNYKTHHEILKDKYAQAGYEMPQIVYWNVRANTSDFNVKADAEGVALIAGFSPSLLKAVLNGQDFSPYGILRQAIDDERYKGITL